METGGAEGLPSAIVGTFRVDQKPVELTAELRHLQGTLIKRRRGPSECASSCCGRGLKLANACGIDTEKLASPPQPIGGLLGINSFYSCLDHEKSLAASTKSVELVSTLQPCGMAVQGGADDVKSSQQALLDLERSKVPPVELLDAVAQILSVNYSHIWSTIFDPELSKEIPRPAASCMPKEEWVLRWLLKRVGLSRSGGKSKVSNEECLRYDHDTDGIVSSTYDEKTV